MHAVGTIGEMKAIFVMMFCSTFKVLHKDNLYRLGLYQVLWSVEFFTCACTTDNVTYREGDTDRRHCGALLHQDNKIIAYCVEPLHHTPRRNALGCIFPTDLDRDDCGMMFRELSARIRRELSDVPSATYHKDFLHYEKHMSDIF